LEVACERTSICGSLFWKKQKEKTPSYDFREVIIGKLSRTIRTFFGRDNPTHPGGFKRKI
jgi:hypothetical protein